MRNPFEKAFKDMGIISDEEYKNSQKEKEERNEKEKTIYGEIVNYYNGGSYKINGELNPEYFNEIPQNIIHELFMKDTDKGKVGKITSTKLRQYYNLVNTLSGLTDDNTLKTELYMVIAKASYDEGRKTLPIEFVQFLRYNTNIIFGGKGGVKENFKVFKKHFECVVAYSKGVLKD